MATFLKQTTKNIGGMTGVNTMIQALSVIAPRAAIGLTNIIATNIKRRVTMDINLKPCSLCGAKMEGEENG